MSKDKVKQSIVVIMLICALGSGCVKKEVAVDVLSVEEVITQHIGWLSQQDGVISIESAVVENYEGDSRYYKEPVIQINFDSRFDSYDHLPVELGGYRIKIKLN